jgi:heat shock protein HslJ
MRYRLRSTVALFVCLIAMSACANPFPSIFGGSNTGSVVPQPTSQLSGSSWVLTQLMVGGKSQTLVPTAPVTLQFQRSDSTYIGSSGCNYYNGDYVVSGSQLNLKFKSVTQAACAGPIMGQEVTYLKALQQVRTYQLSDHTLRLNEGGEGVILVFTAA